jgi:hypothetical protein
MNKHSVEAPRFRKSADAEMMSILIETDTNRRLMSAAAAPPITRANVSHPGRQLLRGKSTAGRDRASIRLSSPLASARLDNRGRAPRRRAQYRFRLPGALGASG